LNPVGAPDTEVSEKMRGVWEAHLETHAEEGLRLTAQARDYSVLRRVVRSERFLHGQEVAQSILESGLAFISARKARARSGGP
jgi:hypothetical protein